MLILTMTTPSTLLTPARGHRTSLEMLVSHTHDHTPQCGLSHSVILCWLGKVERFREYPKLQELIRLKVSVVVVVVVVVH